jgi:hypothetical protein
MKRTAASEGGPYKNGGDQKTSGAGKPKGAENPGAHPNKPRVGHRVIENNSGGVEAAGYYEGVMEAGDYHEGGDQVGEIVD